MISSFIPIDEEAEESAYENPKDRLIKSGLGRDLMRLLMKQPKIKNQKDENDCSKNTKKDSLPIIVIPEKGE